MARKPEIEVIARGVMIERGRVLLCRNVKKSYCYLPGGHVEFGESAAKALAREFAEETGAKVRVGRLLMTAEGVFERKGRTSHEVNLVFHVERTSRREITSLEPKISFEWSTPRTLRAVELRPRLIARWLRGENWRPLVQNGQAWRSDFQ